ncbi:MAG: carbohydrate binding domain-containing protein [Lentisphaerota bacterium]
MRVWRNAIMVTGLFMIFCVCTGTEIPAEFAIPIGGVEIPLPNPGFEDGVPGEMPSGYIGSGKIIMDNPHSGKHCIQQSYTPGYTWNCIQSLPPYITSGENKTYELSVWCRNTVASGSVSLGVRSMKLPGGDGDSIKYNWKPVVNNVNTWQKYTLRFTTPPKNEALAVYFMISADVSSGEVFWDDLSMVEVPTKDELMSVSPLKSAVFFNTDEGLRSRVYDPFYGKFTDIKAEKAFVEIKLDPKAKGLSLELGLKERYNAKKCVYRENMAIRDEQLQLRIPLKFEKLSTGHYTLAIKLVDNSGKILASNEKEIIINGKRMDAVSLEPIRKVEIDADKNLLVNGKPFLMSFYYHYPMVLDDYKELKTTFGATTAQVCGGESIDALCKNVEIAWQAGIYSWAVLFHPAMFDEKTRKWKDAELIEAVNRLKNHPGLIGWDLIDEPDCDPNDEAMTRELARASEIVRKLDPNHPVWVNLCMSSKFQKYVQYSDFASYDTYPFPDMSLTVIEGINKKILDDSGNKKPLITILQTWAAPGNIRPTYDELKAETYLSITQGMKIFAFYSWGDPEPQFCMARSPEFQSYVQNLMVEMNVLKDFLFAPTPEQPVIKDLSEKGLRYIYKSVGGRNYFIAVNISDSIQEYSISLPKHKAGTPIEVLFEDGRKAGGGGSGLKDALAPFGVHVYRY